MNDEITPGTLPPVVQEALRRNAQKAAEKEVSGPRIAFTGNSKLDELLAGIKDFKYEEIQLPSKGRFYDNIPDGIIHVRGMTGEEQLIMGTTRFVKKGQAINKIFENCIKESINPDKLLIFDRSWLLIYLRAISYSTSYEVDVRCSECSTKFSTKIDLDQLNVKKCPDDYGHDNLFDVLPKSGYKISYRLPTGKDESLIQDYREQKMRKDADGTDDTWSYRASLLISDIEGLADKAAIQVLLPKLPIQDVAYIGTLLSDPPFGVDTNLGIVCPYCSELFNVEMPMDIGFFFPKVKKEKNIQA